MADMTIEELKNYEFSYDTDDIDAYINKEDMGFSINIDDAMKQDMKIRRLQNKVIEGYSIDYELSQEEKEALKQTTANRINENKRKASRDDVIVITLTEEQKKKIREDVEYTLVRPDPNNPYNLDDSEVCETEDQLRIYKKLQGLTNAYFNKTDYVNAINIIREAIEFSLEHDYPFMQKEEVIRQFNEGKIKYKYGKIPAFYINFTTQITDPKILAGIVDGSINIVDNKSMSNNITPLHVTRNTESVTVPVNKITDDQYKQYAEMTRQGVDNILSSHFKHEAVHFNRFTMPTNMFAVPETVNPNHELMCNFDWTQEDAAEKYYELAHNVKHSHLDYIAAVEAANNGNINTHLMSTGFNNLLNDLTKHHDVQNGVQRTTENPNMISTSLNYNPQVVALEQSILQSITINNGSNNTIK